MTFNPDARLDPSQVRDRRGVGGGVVIGGGAAIVILLAAMLLGVDPSAVFDAIDTTSTSTVQNVGFVDSVQAYWKAELPRRGATYTPATTVLFSGATQSACGTAVTAMGPFYCPDDEQVYLDISFFTDLRTQLGARAGPFAQGYVVAHEYGHRVQHLTGGLTQSTRTGAQSQSVRVELQADCYAGVWAKNAAATGYLEAPTQDEIADALDAAAAVGDDRIQQQTSGRVTPDSFTHGTSAQRQKWFMTGYQSGDPARCDTSGAL